MNTSNRCCENYNGTLDITNSCIFCKTFIGNINNGIREEKLNTLKSMLWELGHTDKDAHHIIEYVDELLKSQREELVEKIKAETDDIVEVPQDAKDYMGDFERGVCLGAYDVKNRMIELLTNISLNKENK